MVEKIQYQSEGVLVDESDLTTDQRQLLQKTRGLFANAYAPYSRFRVAAIALLENGIMVTGTNQENAAYPSGLCAERVALFQAGSLYPDMAVKTLCISAKNEQKLTDKPVSPCGACLQVISESEYRQQKPMTLMLAGESGKILLIEGVKNLLPFRFLPHAL
jgi:cytidine deaminase